MIRRGHYVQFFIVKMCCSSRLVTRPALPRSIVISWTKMLGGIATNHLRLSHTILEKIYRKVGFQIFDCTMIGMVSLPLLHLGSDPNHCLVMGHQYNILAHILLVIYNPSKPRMGPSHKQAVKEVDVRKISPLHSLYAHVLIATSTG